MGMIRFRQISQIGEVPMKKYIHILLVALMSLLLASCSSKEEVNPIEPFNEYIKLWNNKDFNQMYELLSSTAKEKISKQDFTEKYTKIYDDLEIEELQAKGTNDQDIEVEDEQTEISFPYSIDMETFAGPIAYDHEVKLVKEEIEKEKKKDKEISWKVDWDTSLIFPEMEDGDKLVFNTTIAKRGDILDRNGIALAEVGQALQIGLVPVDMEGKEEDSIKQVAKLLDMAPESIEKALDANWVQPDYFVPIKTISGNDQDLVAKLVAIDGVRTMSDEARVYPLGEAAAHLTGNIGTVTADDMEANPDANYSSNDVIGKRGLEKVLEGRLRGENGVVVEIQKENGITKSLVEKPVKNGENVQLTIDFDIQRTVYEEMKDVVGSAVVLHPKTGETLALVSTPAFDPNALSLGATQNQWAEIQDNPDLPLTIRFNKTYAPGSVFKPLTAAIALNEKKVDWNQTINVSGLTWQKDATWGDFRIKRVSDYGAPVNLEKALIYSDNIFFAQIALDLGKDAFMKGLKNFGFEEEIPYLYPTIESHIGTIDSDGALTNSSIGQGQIEMSLIHLASTYTAFVNKGNMIQPILDISEEKGQVWKKNLVSEQEATNITNALRKVVTDSKGTGKAAKIDGYPLAAKTGTAELKMEQGEKGIENGPFVAFNPDNPELLIAMIVEDIGKVGDSAIAVKKSKNLFEKLK